MDLLYPFRLVLDDNDTVRVEFPDVPEANTFGETEEEALIQARDALETALEFYIEREQDLPKPSPLHGKSGIAPTPLGSLRLQLYQAMRDQNVNKAELARRLGWHYPQVVRLFNFEHGSHVKQLEAALAAVGRTVVVETTPSKMLAAVIGSSTMPRTEVTKKIWAYIERAGLVSAAGRFRAGSAGKLPRNVSATLSKTKFSRTRKATARRSRRDAT
jgi:antitoxin HicB